MSDERVLQVPEPFIAAGEPWVSSIDLFVRPRTKRADCFATKCDLSKLGKLGLDEAHISIPSPAEGSPLQWSRRNSRRNREAVLIRLRRRRG